MNERKTVIEGYGRSFRSPFDLRRVLVVPVRNGRLLSRTELGPTVDARNRAHPHWFHSLIRRAAKNLTAWQETASRHGQFSDVLAMNLWRLTASGFPCALRLRFERGLLSTAQTIASSLSGGTIASVAKRETAEFRVLPVLQIVKFFASSTKCPDRSRHTPCAVRAPHVRLRTEQRRRHTECACYIGCGFAAPGGLCPVLQASGLRLERPRRGASALPRC